MTPRSRAFTAAAAGLLAAVLTAAAVPVAGVFAPRRTGHQPATAAPPVPVRDVNDARRAIVSQLNTLMGVMVTAAEDRTYDRHRAWVGTVPCGNGPAYRMSAIDGVRLAPERQMTVAEQIRRQLPQYGYTIDTLTPRPGGVWLEIHTSGYTAAFRTGAYHDTLSVYVASDCATSPDGQFPLIG